MSTNLIVWLLLGCYCVSIYSSLALVEANKAVARATKDAMKAHGVTGTPVGCGLVTLGWIIAGLWTWYAVDVHDWRFAVIAWLPIAASTFGKALGHRTSGRA